MNCAPAAARWPDNTAAGCRQGEGGRRAGIPGPASGAGAGPSTAACPSAVAIGGANGHYPRSATAA